MKLGTLILIILCGCAVKPEQKSLIITKQSKAEPLVIAPSPHYHTISWTPSYWLDDSTNQIEYSIFSTTNVIDFVLEQTTVNTTVYITNNYPQQLYLIGAHSK